MCCSSALLRESTVEILQRGEEAVSGFAEELVRSGVKGRASEDIRVVLTELKGAAGHGENARKHRLRV